MNVYVSTVKGLRTRYRNQEVHIMKESEERNYFNEKVKKSLHGSMVMIV